MLKPLVDTDDVVLFAHPVGPFAMNQSLLGCKRSGKAVLIDSGAPPEAFIEAAKSKNLTIIALLQTHAHIDHVAGLGPTHQKLPLPIYLHKDDLPVYAFVPQQAQAYGFPVPPLPLIEHHYEDGDTVEVGELTLRVMHTPGHAPGHVCLLVEEHGLLIGGDLLFQGSIGRTDLPLCNERDMAKSLRRVFQLPDHVAVLPGHGSATTIGAERQSNWIAKQAMQKYS